MLINIVEFLLNINSTKYKKLKTCSNYSVEIIINGERVVKLEFPEYKIYVYASKEAYLSGELDDIPF